MKTELHSDEVEGEDLESSQSSSSSTSSDEEEVEGAAAVKLEPRGEIRVKVEKPEQTGEVAQEEGGRRKEKRGKKKEEGGATGAPVLDNRGGDEVPTGPPVLVSATLRAKMDAALKKARDVDPLRKEQLDEEEVDDENAPGTPAPKKPAAQGSPAVQDPETPAPKETTEKETPVAKPKRKLSEYQLFMKKYVGDKSCYPELHYKMKWKQLCKDWHETKPISLQRGDKRQARTLDITDEEGPPMAKQKLSAPKAAGVPKGSQAAKAPKAAKAVEAPKAALAMKRKYNSPLVEGKPGCSKCRHSRCGCYMCNEEKAGKYTKRPPKFPEFRLL